MWVCVIVLITGSVFKTAHGLCLQPVCSMHCQDAACRWTSLCGLIQPLYKFPSISWQRQTISIPFLCLFCHYIPFPHLAPSGVELSPITKAARPCWELHTQRTFNAPSMCSSCSHLSRTAPPCRSPPSRCTSAHKSSYPDCSSSLLLVTAATEHKHTQ